MCWGFFSFDHLLGSSLISHSVFVAGPFEGEVMNLCKRVGLPWGLPCSEVHLYYAPAAMLEMRKWRCVRAHPILPVFTFPVSFLTRLL